MASRDPEIERPSGSGRQARDAVLAAAIADRDPEALAELYDRYSGMLLGLAMRILGDPADAEEVLQEVFLQVWNQAGRYDPTRSSVSTWLVLIARSRAIDRLRSLRVVHRTVTAAQREEPRTHTSPEGHRDVFNLERRQRLNAELEKLPAEQRQVLEMAFYQGLTQSEIARQAGIPLGTVKTRTLLAMRKLRQTLQRDSRDLL